jgi:hypothetical protein
MARLSRWQPAIEPWQRRPHAGHAPHPASRSRTRRESEDLIKARSISFFRSYTAAKVRAEHTIRGDGTKPRDPRSSSTTNRYCQIGLRTPIGVEGRSPTRRDPHVSPTLNRVGAEKAMSPLFPLILTMWVGFVVALMLIGLAYWLIERVKAPSASGVCASVRIST